MDNEILNQYLEEYKLRFNEIGPKEIFKWRAVKCFQDNWDINSEDFRAMFTLSLNKSKIFLDTQNSLSLTMMEEYNLVFPEDIRSLFLNLFNEELDLNLRIESFKFNIERLNDGLFNSKKKSYHDHRTIISYLTLKYPEKYFFYKFNDLKKFCAYFNLDKPTAGKIENVFKFQQICKSIRQIIEKDVFLISFHKKRLSLDCYLDNNLNILTQDFVHAIAYRLSEISNINNNINEIVTSKINNFVDNVNFEGRFINFLENNLENKKLGDLGEQWVIKFEQTKLENAGFHDLAKKVEHSSVLKGDGLGYDIKSYDLNQNQIFIEVKTTRGDKYSTFYISRNELERSKHEKDNYYLYRVYNYSDDKLQAKLLCLKGDLSNVCSVANEYIVNLNTLI